jgi:lysophospholipase L1-like esterase
MRINISFFIFSFYSFLINAQSFKDTIRFIALGDSYTIGESVNESDRWPNQLMDSLSKRGFEIEENNILAKTGWTTTNLIKAINASDLKSEYNLISILIGVNNFYQNQSIETFRLEISKIIDTALVLANQDTSGLFIVTIPDYGYTPFGENRREQISRNTDLYNKIKDSTASKYGIPIINITPISRNGIIDPDLVADDGLHPSKKQYALWVNMMIEELTDNYKTSFENLKKKTNYHLNQSGHQFNFFSDDQGYIEVYDLSGRMITKLNSNVKFSLSSGCFLMRVVVNEQIMIHKVIVAM